MKPAVQFIESMIGNSSFGRDLPSLNSVPRITIPLDGLVLISRIVGSSLADE